MTQLKGIRNIKPYVPGQQPNYPNMIKINTNENSYGPSPKVEAALRAFDSSELKRYSSLTNLPIKEALAAQFQLNPENFMVGNGSDEVLAFAMLAFFNSADPVLFPDITYGFYRVWADLFHVPFKEIPLDESFQIRLSDYDEVCGGIILTNPNAPTGLYHTFETIEAFLQQHQDVVVIIDEAYIDFGGKSVAPLVNNYPNLVVVHTLSKSRSLAGLRIGYAVSNPELIQVLEAVKSSFNPYSVDMIAERLAAVAIEDAEYYRQINREISDTRDTFIQSLAELGFETLPSLTNFVLTTHPKLDIEMLFKKLGESYIFVRHFEKPERLNRYLRISIGTPSEMQHVIEKITQLLPECK